MCCKKLSSFPRMTRPRLGTGESCPVSTLSRRPHIIFPTCLHLGKYYEGIDSSAIQASDQTAYKWNFTSKQTRADGDTLRTTREEIIAATNAREPSRAGPSSSGARVLGPTLPSASDLTLAREYAAEREEDERRYQRKRDKIEARERIEDMVGPKAVGREAMLEKKQVRRQNDRAFRERGEDGLDLDESTTMGGGDSFQQRYDTFCLYALSSFYSFLLGLPAGMLPKDATNRGPRKGLQLYGKGPMP